MSNFWDTVQRCSTCETPFEKRWCETIKINTNIVCLFRKAHSYLCQRHWPFVNSIRNLSIVTVYKLESGPWPPVLRCDLFLLQFMRIIYFVGDDKSHSATTTSNNRLRKYTLTCENIVNKNISSHRQYVGTFARKFDFIFLNIWIFNQASQG